MSETPLPYQLEGASFLALSRRALLGDGMGLGKTAQAYIAARELGAGSLTVVCPAIAVHHWHAERDKWFPDVRKLEVLSFDAARNRGGLPGAHVLVVDEWQYCKNTQSARTRVVCKASRTFPYAWALSGTPMENYADELYSLFRTFFPHVMPPEARTKAGWVKHFCETRPTPWGSKICGNKNDAELRQMLRRVSLARSAEDVNLQLPPLFWQYETLAVKGSGRLKGEEFMEGWTGEADDLPSLINQVGFSRLWKQIGEEKAPLAAEAIREVLTQNPNESIVVFAFHLSVLTVLEEAMREFGVVRVDGSTSPARRQEAIAAFQAGKVRVFLGQITACQTAITLTRATRVFNVEPLPVPTKNLQAAKRAHRIGQTRPVFVVMYAIAGSVDERVLDALRRKERAHARLYGGKE